MSICVRDFKVGETEAVIEYVRQELPNLAERLGIDTKTSSEIRILFMAALEANARRMKAYLETPYVEAVPESQALLDILGRVFVGERVTVEGLEHMENALRFMKDGGNVLFVSNHTSGADTLVLYHVVNTNFDGTAKNWICMSGHVVNLFLMPLTISGGVNRVQIFSVKYCAQADADVQARMRENNARALATIGPVITEGGKCVLLYPEGGRGEGAIKTAEPRTMKIPQLMDMVSPRGLMVLPSYVEATNILPVRRGENEFNEFLIHVQRGHSTLKFAPGIMWKDLQPTDAEVRDWLAGHMQECLGNPSHALKQCLVSKVMFRIAAMAPENARGPYANLEGDLS